MKQPTPIRIIQDPPRDGPTNMARDETLLRRVGQGESAPTLRLYRWDRPTISLGYFQRYAAYEALAPPAGTLPVVRRLTGGGAILHDLELTYSLTLPGDHPLIAEGANRLYELAHDTIMACLNRMNLSSRQCGTTDDSTPTRGPFFCFQRRHRYDVLLGEDKIAGSAQRRTRSAILQHGSVILASRFPQQPSAVLDHPSQWDDPSTAKTPRGSQPPDRRDREKTEDPITGAFAQAFEQAVEKIRSTFATRFREITDQPCEPGDWLPRERQEADSLIAKYAGDEWTRRT